MDAIELVGWRKEMWKHVKDNIEEEHMEQNKMKREVLE